MDMQELVRFYAWLRIK